MHIGKIEHEGVTWTVSAHWRHQSRSRVPAIDLLFEPLASLSAPPIKPVRIEVDREGVQMLARRGYEQDLEHLRRYLIQALRAAGI
jgi:hypothetical protein